MEPTKQLPQTLYIADPKERLINFFADELFDQLIKEVESEQDEKEKSNTAL